MRKKIRTLAILLLMLLGVGVMAYPSLSDYVNTLHGSYAIREYAANLADMPSAERERQRALAEEYNHSGTGGYEEILDFGNGIMGYLSIPKIGVELSIYHGTTEAVLQKGVGHMPNSAFPIGGAGNHAVLTGHTGLPSARLFTDLTELEEGDRFFISILGEILAYEVDQIRAVLPEEVEDLAPVRGMDYCTLVTCTPYGINSHRLLVRGKRVEPAEEAAIVQTAVGEAGGVEMPPELLLALIVMGAAAAAGVMVLLRKEKGDAA